MLEVQMLQAVFMEVLNWNGARINFLSNFIIALIKVKNVNFVEIATAFSGRAKKESKYKRIKRFFSFFMIDSFSIAKLIILMLSINKDGPWPVVMDRTNWKFGKLDINILLLGLPYKGIAFPLLWMLLSKKGNSNTHERIQLLDRFINLFGVEKIKFFGADREFIGKKWFSYLLGKNVPFRIRIRENILVSNSRGILVPVKNLFRDLKVGEYRILEGRRQVCGVELFVIGLFLPSGEYLILVTDSNPDTALDDYAQRWEIETLFGCLKSRGFRFEETHMTDPERISKLVALLAIAFCWAHITGEWLNDQKPIKIKKHGRKAISIFRYGFDYLREMILNMHEKYQEFEEMIELLRKYLTSSSPPFSDKINSQETDSKNKNHYKHIFDQLECPTKLAIAA